MSARWNWDETTGFGLIPIFTPPRKGRRKGENERGSASPPFFLLSMVPCASSLVTRVLFSPQCKKQRVWAGRKRLHCSCEIQRAAHSLLFAARLRAISPSHAWADGDKRRESETFSYLSSRLRGWLARSLVAWFALQNKVEKYLFSLIRQRFDQSKIRKVQRLLIHQ